MNILVDKTVLFIDLDGTLIKTASGNTFPKDCTDFIIRKEVLDKIAERLPNLFLIGIVTNQGGIPQFISKRDFETKFESIIQFVGSYLGSRIPKLNIEAKVFVTGLYCASIEKSDKSRKPNAGMLEYLQKEFVSEHDKSQMIMIGDASGKPGDFSDSDKKCAENFGIDYLDIEDFLNNKGV
mgnify:FL=1